MTDSQSGRDDMRKRLKGKRAVVTAAGQGIGRATALAFAKEGATVFASDINGAALEAVRTEQAGIETSLLDVTDEDAVGACARQLGGIDILFNCAGYVHHGTILDCSENDWDFIILPERQVHVPHHARVHSQDNRARRR